MCFLCYVCIFVVCMCVYVSVKALCVYVFCVWSTCVVNGCWYFCYLLEVAFEVCDVGLFLCALKQERLVERAEHLIVNT